MGVRLMNAPAFDQASALARVEGMPVISIVRASEIGAAVPARASIAAQVEALASGWDVYKIANPNKYRPAVPQYIRCAQMIGERTVTRAEFAELLNAAGMSRDLAKNVVHAAIKQGSVIATKGDGRRNVYRYNPDCLKVAK